MNEIEKIQAKEMVKAIKAMDKVKRAYVNGVVAGLTAQTMSQAKEADPS